MALLAFDKIIQLSMAKPGVQGCHLNKYPVRWWCSFELSWPCGIGWMGQSPCMQDAGSLGCDRTFAMVFWRISGNDQLDCMILGLFFSDRDRLISCWVVGNGLLRTGIMPCWRLDLRQMINEIVWRTIYSAHSDSTMMCGIFSQPSSFSAIIITL